MSNVYEIAQGFDTLWELIEDETVEDAVLEDAFANLTDDLKDKFENCCKYIKIHSQQDIHHHQYL